MIFLMVGGRAERMGRGVKSIDMTKGLMSLPVYGQDTTETITDRTLRLLRDIDIIKNLEDVVMCVGYKHDLVTKKYPENPYLKTYDIDNPTDVAAAFLKVIDTYPNEKQYIFLLGDVVWSLKALYHFFSVADISPMVCYHSSNMGYTEIYGVALNGEGGCDLIRKVNVAETVPVIPGEIRWEIQSIKHIKPKDCRTSCIEQWIDLKKLPGKVRIYQVGNVDDIDWDEDHQRVCKAIKNGEFD